MPRRFDAPEKLDPNDLQAVLALVAELKACGVRTFEHPCGLKLTLDVRPPAAPVANSEF